MSQPQVVVIGGGVIGVCTAYYLAENRQRVTLLEQDELGLGASFGNAGQITPGHLALNRPGTLWRNFGMLVRPASALFVPPRVDLPLAKWFWRFHRACNRQQVRETTRILAELGHAAFDLFYKLAAKIDFGFYDAGNLEVCETKSSLQQVEQEAELLRSLGYESRILTDQELIEREPSVSGKVAGAVYHLQSATCDPYAFVVELAAAAKKRGADIRTETRVVDIKIRSGNRAVVVTGSEEIEADKVVIACGAWTPQLARRLGLKLPIQPGKGYHVDLESEGDCVKTPFVMHEKRLFIARIQDFVRLAGTMEFSGFNLDKRPARIKMLLDGARQHLAGNGERKVLSEWCHLRPMSPDGLPMLGPIPTAEDVWVASGHGMLGLTQGPITGKIIADALSGENPEVDIAPLRPDRF